MPDVPYEEISDMEEAGAEQPDYEDPNWKPGMSRKTSPFNHTGNKGHKHWNKDGTVKKDPPKREKPKKVEKVNTEPSSKVVAVKGKETKGASEVKITKKVTGKPKGTKTAKDAGVVDSSGRTGSKKDERKKRRKERKAIRKDKTLSRSQKTMAKKESREKQKDNNKKEKSTSSSNSRGGMMRKSSPVEFHEPKGAEPGDRLSHGPNPKTKKEIIAERNKRAKTPHPSKQDKTLKK
jgi:hypothetical protein